MFALDSTETVVEPSDRVVERFGAGEGRSDTIVEPSGFTFVEEDDVAFTLQLCREVHRLYGDYQVGGLALDDYVLAGLTVTMEMLATLSNRITDGMPGMRISVAAAQAREMLAVMFGRDPLEGPLEGRYRAHYRAIVDESARALGSTPAPLPAGWAEAALGRSPLGIETGSAPGAETAPAAAADQADGLHPSQGLADLRSALRRVFARRAK